MKYSLIKRLLYFLSIGTILLSASCNSGQEKRFRLVDASESGITFKNELSETPDFNIFNYMYFYNGGGVAVGDVNGDDLLDIYFTANQLPNKLYINRGEFKFEDVSVKAGVEGFKGWATGVNMVDVNNDGKLDIYVSYIGDYEIYQGKNQLFINEGNDENGVPKFSDQALNYGLDLVGFSTQAAFFDFDLDGDLDMYMLNHSLHQNGTYGRSELRYKTHPLAGDKLLRNNEGKFINVTEGSGIYSSVIGYGLGITISDINLDGLPDVYVGNDFHEDDYLYINLGNGKFKDSREQYLTHTSHFSMGCDFADFNNDAFPDLISLDMLPADPKILKASAAEDPYDTYEFKLRFGYGYQFARNTLQLNQGDGTFSEIGLLAGVAATDWSWSSLFADFDLDGRKDIFIANGIKRRSNDLDYINFITHDSIQRIVNKKLNEKDLELINLMPQIKIPNYLYVNNGDSTFSNKSEDWGLDKISYSNGAAYADLDNDGDLDLVINNVDDEAFLYENRTIQKDKLGENYFLKIKLMGNSGNHYGYGTKVFLYSKGKLQMQECMPTRGFESAVDYRLVFGLGAIDMIDSIKVIWPGATYQVLKNVKANQTLELKQVEASGTFDYSVFHPTSKMFRVLDVDSIGIKFKHRENKFVEFNREALIPHMMSSEGPGVAIGDVNGDGTDDIYLGGAKWQEGSLYTQNAAGKFSKLAQPSIAIDSTAEDVSSLFVDIDQDNDLDLIVISGGNEFAGSSPHMKPRLYLNDGLGHFTKSSGLPDLFITGSCVSASDYDKDGDIDLFIGVRTIPWKYGIKPDSYLLQNDGKGNFKDVTDQQASQLRKIGFIKDAIWVDIDGDKDDDLVIAGDWMPITILINSNGILKSLEQSGLEQEIGWWNCVESVDFDQDGDIDLVAGNLGLNSKLKASTAEPLRMYVKDFDNNETIEQLLTYYIDGKEYLFHTRDELTKQLPGLKKKYLSYARFGEAEFKDIFSEKELNTAEKFEVNRLESMIIENLGGGKFKLSALPKAAQFSPTMSIMVDDVDQDKLPDLILGSNFFPINIQMGRYDGSYGTVLKNKGKSFEALPPSKTGWSIKGEVRHLEKINIRGEKVYLAIRNNDVVYSYKLIKK